MKTKLLKKLRKKYSKGFIIVEDDPEHKGYKYVLYNTEHIILPHCTNNINTIHEWIDEYVTKWIWQYIDEKRGRRKKKFYDYKMNRLQ